MDHRPSSLSHACLPPFPTQPPQRTILPALFPHPDQPVVLAVVQASLAVRFDHEVIPPNLELDRQLIHGVQGSDVGPISVATAPEVLLVDGFEDSRDRALPPRVLHGRYPERAALPVTCREIVPRDAFGSGALPLPALDQVVYVLLQMWLVPLGADVIDAIRRLLPDVVPTLVEIRLIAPLLEGANPRLRLLLGLLRYALPDG
jgi:hypothetical protein